jgi:DNA-binding response OmpR family regulator
MFMSLTNEPVRERMSLKGLSVLVVEDDYLLAKEVASTLRECGAVVLGPVPDIARGRALLTESVPDCALLDINLKGHFVYELAEELIRLGVPPIFTTGYDSSFLPEPLTGRACLQKPLDMRNLVLRIREETSARR